MKFILLSMKSNIKRGNTSLLFLLLLLFTVSCKEGNVSRQISELYSNRGIKFDPETRVCIILPEVGCGGCIAEGTYFILSNKQCFSSNQRRNLVVFTSINSKKMLLRNMEIDSPSELNCIMDTTNIYLPTGNERIYPLILLLEKGKIIEAEFQSPHNSGNLLNRIILK